MDARSPGLCAGWEILCPDGSVRHYPYHDLEDAEEDANLAASDCRLGYDEPSPLELIHPPCPGGVHTVVPMVMVHTAAIERGQA